MPGTPNSRAHKEEMRSGKKPAKGGSNYDKPKPAKKKQPKAKKK